MNKILPLDPKGFAGSDRDRLSEIRKLSDGELSVRLARLAGEERRLQTEVLWHLREAERRRLYAKRGYSSLFEYVVKELKYSESAAFRRISAMRLVKEFPEIESKIEDGSLKIQQLAAFQSFVKTEEKSVGRSFSIEQKRELLKRVENRSYRETVTELSKAAVSAQSVSPEKVRDLVSGTEIRFFADQPLMTKFTRVREIAAHRLRFSQAYSDLFHVMGDLVLDRFDPLRKPQKSGVNELVATSQPTGKVVRNPDSFESSAMPALAMDPVAQKGVRPFGGERGNPGGPAPSLHAYQPALIPTPTTRYIPERIRIQVWHRDQGRCQYRDPESQKICDSRVGLQIDHIKRVRDGGTSSSADNLRLLCGAHNRLRG